MSEPRTEAGKRLLDILGGTASEDYDSPTTNLILAIEAEAAAPSAPDAGLTVDALRTIAFLRSCIESGERLSSVDIEDLDEVVRRLKAALAHSAAPQETEP